VTKFAASPRRRAVSNAAMDARGLCSLLLLAACGAPARLPAAPITEVAAPAEIAPDEDDEEVELGPDGGDVTARFELPRDPQLDARAGKIAGWSLIGVGVAAMATGIGLVVLDENPVKNDCSGVHVDRFGNCEFRWNTMGAGVGLLVPGVLAAAAGTTLVVLDARRRRDPDRARARVGVGVARVDLTLRF